MDEILQINLFNCSENRIPFCFKNIDEILKIDSNLLSKIKLNVYTNDELYPIWKFKETDLEKFSSYNIITQFGNHYMNRTHHAASSNCKYSCRLDDDIFMSSYVWEYVMNNITILDNSDVGVLNPILTTSTFSCELFINQFLNSEQQEYIFSIFKRDNIYSNIWGIDYSPIHVIISNTPKWDGFLVFNELRKLPTFFRGVHPIRFSSEANESLAKMVLGNFEKIQKRHEYSIVNMVGYHDTHFMFFTTELWKNSLKKSYDSFDEISINQYCRENNLSMSYINNGFGIHMCHGIVSNQSEIEKMYIEFIDRGRL